MAVSRLYRGFAEGNCLSMTFEPCYDCRRLIQRMFCPISETTTRGQNCMEMPNRTGLEQVSSRCILIYLLTFFRNI